MYGRLYKTCTFFSFTYIPLAVYPLLEEREEALLGSTNRGAISLGRVPLFACINLLRLVNTQLLTQSHIHTHAHSQRGLFSSCVWVSSTGLHSSLIGGGIALTCHRFRSKKSGRKLLSALSCVLSFNEDNKRILRLKLICKLLKILYGNFMTTNGKHAHSMMLSLPQPTIGIVYLE